MNSPSTTRESRVLGAALTAWTAILLASLTPALAHSPPPEGKKVALLVGVNKYDRRLFNDLSFAERDVEDMAAVLEKGGYEVHLLTGGASGAERATLKNIQAAIETVLKERTKRDLVLVGLAGHGLQIEVTNDAGKLQAESFYCPVDAESGNSKSMLGMGHLFEEINRRGGGRNLVLVDACREDPTRGRGMDGSTVKTLPEGVAVLFGCAAGQKTYETEKASGGHGVFFHTVLEGLRGAARKTEAGDVTWTSLVEYVTDNVETDLERFVGKTPLPQTPNLVTNLRGRSPIILPRLETRYADSIGLKFAAIKPGEFWMGSSAEEVEQALKDFTYSKREEYDDEQPRHRVRITKPFLMATTTVTVGQFRKFVEDADYKTDAEKDGKGGRVYNSEKTAWESDAKTSWRSPGFAQNANHPVVQASWNDAVEFCKWLSRKDGRTFRLPTEAEWEYCCRAGSTTRYWFGDDPEGLADVGNVADATAKAKFTNWTTIKASDGYVFTAPVGSFKPNAWGLYDMHGNVWQWCQDYYEKDYYKDSPPEDPQGPERASDRVYRGGGWSYFGQGCRSAIRNWSSPDFGGSDLGFRVALVQSRK